MKMEQSNPIELPPTLVEMEQREKESQALLKTMGEQAKQLMAKGMLQAAGYRILIKPITVKRTLEAAEIDLAPTLAAKGFESKTENQREKEERGENHGIVLHLGPTAFDRLGTPWCDEGDVVIYSRYAGTRVEHPPGSKNFFQIVNDEDIFGRIV
jgi:co-chaperonin GroES (HSP10)